MGNVFRSDDDLAEFPFPWRVLVFDGRPQRTVLHIQSTMADSRAMTATPENMSRICSNDCLESVEKEQIYGTGP